MRGTLTYDINHVTYPVWIGLVEMIIENPRTGDDLRFVKDVKGLWADVFQFNVPNTSTQNGKLEIIQSVVPPKGYQGEAPIINAYFVGPSDRLDSRSLLADLTLDKRPIAMLSFYDIHNALDANTYITAEISSLTPLQTTVIPGDFDCDGRIDADELFARTKSFGFSAARYADANGDGRTDGADFLIWQQQLGGGPSMIPRSAQVPEPSAMLLCSAWAALKSLTRRRTSAYSAGRAPNE